MSENTKHWLRAFILTAIIFLLFSLYLYLRRGYFDLYIANKVFGSTAALLAGITLVIGPLSKRIPFLIQFAETRKQIGLLAFGIALLHIGASLFQTERFPWFSWYLNEWIPISLGLIAVATWTYMSFISRGKKIKQMGVDVWQRRLSLAGKIGFISIFLHLLIMKYPGWIRWFNGQVKATPELANPGYPPASLLLFIVMVLIIVFRVINTYFHKRKA